MKKSLSISMILLAVIFMFNSCNSVSKNGGYYNEYLTEDADFVKAESEEISYGGFTNYNGKTDGGVVSSPSSQENNSIISNRKIIYSSSYSIQTTEFEKSVAALDILCHKYGAYYESSESYGTKENSDRYGSFTVRVPVENYNAFKKEAGNIGVVIRSSENNRDVTENYIDTEARLTSAKIREERLLAILENADTLDDILLLEAELADVRYEIESLSGSLRKYDSLISYSTITIGIEEVVEPVEIKPVPKTFSQKMSTSISDGFEDFSDSVGNTFLDFLYNLPIFIILVVTIVIIYVIIRTIIKKVKNQNK